ncbi:MAG TPA: trypsin-like peptidase domain-containing protein [Acidimicrobiia bacterium]
MTEPGAPPARHGVLRVSVVVWFLVIATAVAVVLAITDIHGDRPGVIEQSPAAAGHAPVLGPPPSAVPLSRARQRAIADSVVRVTGTACQEIQQGSGFVVHPGYVLTDAHVVAGERDTMVVDHGGHQLSATVVRFDPVRDLALLRVANGDPAGLPPLALAPPRAPADLAVFGHPEGGSLRVAPARLIPAGINRAVGRDIYGHAAPGTRRILELAARLAPGDSGAPVVNTGGRVVGVAFAIDPAGRPVAYALSALELATIDTPPADFTPVSTGACVSL